MPFKNPILMRSVRRAQQKAAKKKMDETDAACVFQLLRVTHRERLSMKDMEPALEVDAILGLGLRYVIWPWDGELLHVSDKAIRFWQGLTTEDKNRISRFSTEEQSAHSD